VHVLGRVVRTALVAAAVAVGLVLVGRVLVGVAGGSTVLTGLNEDAERGGCPGTPNCVSSFATTEDHAIDPIACVADGATAVVAFADAIEEVGDVQRTGDRSWVVFSRLLRFPDDVNIRPSQRGIEVYSASRLGSGDLGVNRRRIERVRDLVAEDPRCGAAGDATGG
jgi:uncharacterized protein (DUF1499 family)